MQSTKNQTRPCERSVGRVLRFFDSFQRKFDFESRAFRFGRERFYRSVVKIDDVFRYRETQSDAARRPRFFRAIESVEDMRQVFVGDYRTAIIYRKHCFCSVFGKVYANFAALRFVLYRVIDEYHKQPAYHLVGCVDGYVASTLGMVETPSSDSAQCVVLRAELATKKTRSVANAFFS